MSSSAQFIIEPALRETASGARSNSIAIIVLAAIVFSTLYMQYKISRARKTRISRDGGPQLIAVTHTAKHSLDQRMTPGVPEAALPTRPSKAEAE